MKSPYTNPWLLVGAITAVLVLVLASHSYA